VSTNGINGTPQPFPAVTEPKPRRPRKRKSNGPTKRFEIRLRGDSDNRIGSFKAADEVAAKKEFEEIVPVEWRAKCEWREVK